jgi:hypothetical protein
VSILRKNGLGQILGDFFSNSSGHHVCEHEKEDCLTCVSLFNHAADRMKLKTDYLLQTKLEPKLSEAGS